MKKAVSGMEVQNVEGARLPLEEPEVEISFVVDALVTRFSHSVYGTTELIKHFTFANGNSWRL